MNSKATIILFSMFAGCSILFTSCRKDDIPEPEFPQPKPSLSTPITTAPGTPLGSEITSLIGPAGGTISSLDGGLTITFPEGALSAETEIGIQPISNTAPSGIGQSYRLTPEGTSFNIPVQIEFVYQDSDIQGFPEELLWIVTQKSNGTWDGCRRITPNTAQNSIRVSASHFSDWALGKFIDLKLTPNAPSVIKGQTKSLLLVGFSTTQDDLGDLVPLYPMNTDNGELVPLVPVMVDETRLSGFQLNGWSLNGINAPTSGSNGSLSFSGFGATYTAPQQLPTPNPVSVSVSLKANNYLGGISTYLITTPITVLDDGYYLTMEVNGNSYTFYEWGFNGQAPPNPEDVYISNCGMSDGKLTVTGSHMLNGSLGEASIVITIANPIIGSINLEGFSILGEDEASITSTQLPGSQYFLDYTERWMENQVCHYESRSGAFTVTLTAFDIENHIATGSYMGNVYHDPQDVIDNCQTSESVSVSGNFNLYIAW